MLIANALDIQGNLTIQKISTSEEIIETIHAHNNIVTTGRDLVAKLFIKQSVGTISHFAVGTGSNQTLPNETKLNQEIFRKKLPDLSPNDLKIMTLNDSKGERVKLSINAELETGEANGTLTEAALFTGERTDINDPNSPIVVMYNRVVFQPINKTKEFKLNLVWEILF